MTRVLLVQPKFPIPSKSLNHKDYLPIGLLKLATWHRRQGDEVALSLGDARTDFEPDEIYVTSLFTYWADHVRQAVHHYRQAFPKACISVGGIYASLQPDHCLRHTGCDRVWRGVHDGAEECEPDYSLVETDFQIIHASRGCIRRCPFCGTYEIEPEFRPKMSIESEIVKNHVVFYDNNLLANPHIDDLLAEVSRTRIAGRVVTCESQSGFDGRILLRKPRLAQLLKKARFRAPRIAWDGGLADAPRIKKQLEILRAAGFAPRDTQVFMLYNHDLPPNVLFAKVENCYQWGVQVSDCRYRPLDSFTDGYQPWKKQQAADEYYMHEGWDDVDVRRLRAAVRTNNICLRYRIPRQRYAKHLEGLSAAERRSIGERLGISPRRYSLEQLDAINKEWLRSQGDAHQRGTPRANPLTDSPHA